MSCPQKSDQEKIKQAPNYLGAIMDSMGIESCKKSNSRDTTQVMMEGDLKIGPGGLGGGASFSAQGKTESLKSISFFANPLFLYSFVELTKLCFLSISTIFSKSIETVLFSLL